MSTVCRVCLAGGGNVTLCPIENAFLTDIYEKLTDYQFYSEDGRPRVLCCFCYRRLLRCCTLSEMARRSETIFSDLFFKGLEATSEVIEDLNLRTKEHLNADPMQHLEDETPNSSAIIIKEEPVSVKEDRTVQDKELVATESVDTPISEECIKSQLIFEEDSNEGNNLIENSTEMDIKEINLATDIGILELDQAHTLNQKVEVHPDESKLMAHIQLSHTKEQQCKRFDKKLRDVYLKRQKRDHSGVKPYDCNLCDKQFNWKSDFIRHTRLHTGEKPYPCSICDKRFNRKSNLVKHTRVHSGVKSYACRICDKQFNQNSNLVTHMRVHTGVKPHTHACSICEKQFEYPSRLISHLRVHTGEKPYACSVCKNQFKHKSHLVTHMGVHTGEKPFICGICDKQFGQKSGLVTHIRIHTGEKPYACNICGKKCNEKARLITHMRIHSDEKPYACSICKKQFRLKSYLVTHMRIHTGEKPYACSICDKKFNRKYHLIMHNRIHTKEKPYACNICDKQFSQKINLDRHKKIHTGEKP